MSLVKQMIVPGWPKYIPGFLLCVFIAFVAMNVDHVLLVNQKAHVASEKLEKLYSQRAELIILANKDVKKQKALKEKIKKQIEKVKKAGGKPGEKWPISLFLYQKLQFKYVALLLLGGILIRNIFGVHKIFLPGVGIARPLIKPGIIILGVHYVWSDVIKVGGTGLILASVFIFGTAIIVMWLCRKYNVTDGLGGIMGAGTGVCGVSAIIATAPVVNAKPRDMAYAIGTILLFGTAMLFIMPYMGKAIGVSESQFGAWVALAILNTAQLIAAAEWFGEGARDTAVLINAARIMLIPLIVVFAVWFYGLKGKGKDVGFWTTVKSKFPIFILGFFALIILNSMHIEMLGGPKIANSPFRAMNAVYKWFFAVGFAGIGMSISLEDMKKAGGQAFIIGSGAAFAKMILGLIVVLILGAKLLSVKGGM